jgi:hypothetical protein
MSVIPLKAIYKRRFIEKLPSCNVENSIPVSEKSSLKVLSGYSILATTLFMPAFTVILAHSTHGECVQ